MKLICYSLIALIISISGYAQSLTGIVYELDDKNEKVPLIGTNIFWEGTQTGTTTDVNGIFNLKKINSDHLHLVVSYIGYEPVEIEIPFDQDTIEITLSVNRELKEVVVTGTSLSKFIDELDAKQTEVITSKELLKAACCNLSESFTTNASVDVQFQDAVTGAKQIQLLGLSGLYNQMLFENIPTLKGIGGTFGLGYIPGPWMTSISISKGAASVVNGYESITGQINLEYKKPDDVERYYFNAFQSSHYKTEFNANAATHLNPNLSTMILAHADFNLKTFDDNNDSFRDQPNVKQFNFVNRWKYQSYKGFESQFGVQVLNEERRGGQVSDFGSNNSTTPYNINIDTKRYEVFAKNGYVFDDEAYTSVGLILNAQWHDQNSLLGLRRYNGNQKSFYANLLFETKTADDIHSVTMGGSFAYDNYKESFDGLVYDRNESRPGIFTEYTYSPSNIISIVPGIRFDFHNLYGTFFTPRLHLKYNIDENTTLRASAGKGFRSVNLFAENLNYLASSREFIIVNSPSYEEAWNYGLNLTRYISINDRELRVTAEFYRTDFLKQTIVDVDSDVRQVRFYDLNGKSYSNNYQIEMAYQPIERFDVTAALRYTDVKSNYGSELLIKPLSSEYKGLLTLSYATEENSWMFDSSFLLNGGGRIPSTKQNPAEYQRAETFPAYLTINAQITKRIEIVDLYLGVENLTNYKQTNPIIASNDPFGNYFDASMIWGPIDGAKFYFGLRMSVL
ncbi:MAG TPA: TonB-dependent receptor [Ignavibacteriaceae bacterium]|nr:TonB-dependent receptor [Ignavibacteriaceae bacterium]HRP94088.1 TonB-dependent receptor [Ignavibacteriaceae bacterium]HRQ53854.1 TonB-dependent receptor [Ignavibacteriaceae bacterium]